MDQVACSLCGHKLSAKEYDIGKIYKCPKCNRLMVAQYTHQPTQQFSPNYLAKVLKHKLKGKLFTILVWLGVLLLIYEILF